MMWYDVIYLLTAIGLPPGGSSTVHIYTQTIHRTIQNNNRTTQITIKLVEALRYQPEGCGFDSRRCLWNFFIDIILPTREFPWRRLSL